MVAGTRGVSSGMSKIGVLVIDNVPKRRVLLCAECEDEECKMAERYLDEHDVPYKLIIVSGYDTPVVLTTKGDCLLLHHGIFGREDIESRMDELRKYCA